MQDRLMLLIGQMARPTKRFQQTLVTFASFRSGFRLSASAFPLT